MQRILDEDPRAQFVLPSVLPGDRTPLMMERFSDGDDGEGRDQPGGNSQAVGEKVRALAGRLMDRHLEAMRGMRDRFLARNHRLLLSADDRVLVVDITNPLRQLIDQRQRHGFDRELRATVSDDCADCGGDDNNTATDSQDSHDSHDRCRLRADCADPNRRIYLDNLHPTAPVHWFLAKIILRSMLRAYHLSATVGDVATHTDNTDTTDTAILDTATLDPHWASGFDPEAYKRFL